jgi:hypothetical protein
MVAGYKCEILSKRGSMGYSNHWILQPISLSVTPYIYEFRVARRDPGNLQLAFILSSQKWRVHSTSFLCKNAKLFKQFPAQL